MNFRFHFDQLFFSFLSSGTILEKKKFVCDIVQLTEQVFAGEIPGAENCKEWKVLWIRCNFHL